MVVERGEKCSSDLLLETVAHSLLIALACSESLDHGDAMMEVRRRENK